MEFDIEELLEAPFKNEPLDSSFKNKEDDEETKLLYSFDIKDSDKSMLFILIN